MVIIQAKPIASELLAQHAVRFFEVVDYVALVLVQLAGEGNQQQDGIWYGHLAREEQKDLKFLRNGTVRYGAQGLCRASWYNTRLRPGISSKSCLLRVNSRQVCCKA